MEKCNDEIVIKGTTERVFRCVKLLGHKGLHSDGSYEWS